MRSILADDKNSLRLPWEDVVVDVQGPFTMSDQGFQYVLSYHFAYFPLHVRCGMFHS